MKRWILWCLSVGVLWLFSADKAWTLDRPDWMDEPGIVMAGNWEEPTFRARRMGRLDFTLPPELLEGYAREHSPEMVAELKELGVNFLMIHCYKGAGLETERQGMEDAKRLAALARQAGMRVGTYIGGTMLYERLFKEEPKAPQWQAFGPAGEPLYYSSSQKFRYAAVRNHPDFIEYLKKPVRFAIEEVKADLIHFDNFGLGSASYDPVSRQQFRAFLKARGMAEAEPPASIADLSDPLVRAWLDFKCQALADHYAAMSKYIRSLNPRCGVESNPGSVLAAGRSRTGVDHARLMPHGNASWDEARSTAWDPKSRTARTRIRSLKVGRLFNNSTFLYTETPLDAAESMAFNLNCLGSVAWFEGGRVRSAHLTDQPIHPELKTYIRFFLDRPDLFRRSKTVADVAVLRTFAETNFGPSAENAKRNHIEQGLIQGAAAWRIIFDGQLDALDDYRVVVVPGAAWLTEDQRKALDAFAARGGVVVPAMGVADPAEAAVMMRDKLRLVVEAPPSVAVELCEQASPKRVLVHFVNYNTEETLENVKVNLQLKSGRPTRVRLLSPDPAGDKVLKLQGKGGRYSFTLPKLKVYAVAVIEGASVQ